MAKLTEAGEFYWKGDTQLVLIEQKGGGHIAVMGKHSHGPFLIDRAIELVRILNAGRAALTEGKDE